MHYPFEPNYTAVFHEPVVEHAERQSGKRSSEREDHLGGHGYDARVLVILDGYVPDVPIPTILIIRKDYDNSEADSEDLRAVSIQRASR